MLQGILLGFNTSANVYILMSLSAPVYNYTTNTVNFNYLLKTPNATAATNATNGFLVNLFVTQPDSVSGAIPMTAIPKETILFTPSLLTTMLLHQQRQRHRRQLHHQQRPKRLSLLKPLCTASGRMASSVPSRELSSKVPGSSGPSSWLLWGAARLVGDQYRLLRLEAAAAVSCRTMNALAPDAACLGALHGQ